MLLLWILTAMREGGHPDRIVVLVCPNWVILDEAVVVVSDGAPGFLTCDAVRFGVCTRIAVRGEGEGADGSRRSRRQRAGRARCANRRGAREEFVWTHLQAAVYGSFLREKLLSQHRQRGIPIF